MRAFNKSHVNYNEILEDIKVADKNLKHLVMDSISAYNRN